MNYLVYRIGGLKIVPDKLVFLGTDSYEAGHKFVAQSLDDTIFLFVAKAHSHSSVSRLFDLDERNLVGGGSCYIDRDNKLVLDEFSKSYGAIPKKVGQELASILISELKKMGIETRGIIINPFKGLIQDFWINKGFSKQ